MASALLMNLSCLASPDPRSQEAQSVPGTNYTFFSLKLCWDKCLRVPDPSTQVLGGCQPGTGDIWRQGHCSFYKDTKDSTGIYTQHPCCCENPAASTGSGLERTYPCQTFLQGTLAACPSQYSITSTLAVLRVLRTHSPSLQTLPDPSAHGSSQLVIQSSLSCACLEAGKLRHRGGEGQTQGHKRFTLVIRTNRLIPLGLEITCMSPQQLHFPAQMKQPCPDL